MQQSLASQQAAACCLPQRSISSCSLLPADNHHSGAHKQRCHNILAEPVKHTELPDASADQNVGEG